MYPNIIVINFSVYIMISFIIVFKNSYQITFLIYHYIYIIYSYN